MNPFLLSMILYPFLCSDAYHLRGKYIVVYPFRKQIAFHEKNHEIKDNMITLSFHREDKKYYFLNASKDYEILRLENVHNHSDYILLHKFMKNEG